MFRFALDLKAGTRAPEVCQKKTLNGFFEVNDPLSEKVRNPKEFTTIPIIDVLCSNFKDIGRREVRETMMVTKNFAAKCDFFRRHFAPVFGRAPKVCRRACDLGQRLLNFVPIGSSLPELFAESDFVRPQ